MRTAVVLASALLEGLLAVPVAAQVIDRPAAPPPAVVGTATTSAARSVQQTVVLNVNLLGGYGNGTQGFGVTPDLVQKPTYTGFADGAIRVRRFSARRGLEMSGRVYGTSYTQPRVQPLWGSDVRVQADTGLGRRGSFDVSLHAASDPFVTLGGLASLQPDVGLTDAPPSSPVQRLSDVRSWSVDSSASVRHRWSRRNALTGRYDFGRRSYPEGLGYDNTVHRAEAGYERDLARTVVFTAAYRFAHTDTRVSPTATTPLDQHAAEGGFRYDKRLSRSRSLAFTFGVGSTRVTATPADGLPALDQWLPTGYGGVALYVGRAGSLRLDYRRAVSVLPSISPDAYVTNGFYVGGGSALGAQVDVSVSGSYAFASYALDNTNPADVTDYAATAQLRYAATTWVGAVVSYSYYRRDYRSIAGLPVAVPARLGRHLVQVGLTFTIPLSQPRTSRPGARRPGGGS